jgi:hypothetical protein
MEEQLHSKAIPPQNSWEHSAAKLWQEIRSSPKPPYSPSPCLDAREGSKPEIALWP